MAGVRRLGEACGQVPDQNSALSQQTAPLYFLSHGDQIPLVRYRTGYQLKLVGPHGPGRDMPIGGREKTLNHHS
jgi:hypothetical protein